MLSAFYPFRYDIELNEWHDLTTFPTTAVINGDIRTLQHFTLTAYRDRIYKIGGGFFMDETGEPDETQYERDVLCYDPATDSWRSVCQINENRMCAATFVHDDTLYVIGNTIFGMEYGNYVQPSIERFDAESQTFVVVSG